MKKKIFFTLLTLLLSCGAVQAESNGYILSFRKGHEACAEKYNIKPVVREMGIYYSETAEGFDMSCVENISPNKKMSLIKDNQAPASVSLYEAGEFSSQQQMIHADAMKKLEAYGNEIRVAVIDTGCYEHPEFKSNMLPGWDYLSGTEDVTDNIGHGTHVCGIIASRMDDTAITGIAPKAKIVPLKCFEKSKVTYIDDIIPAIFDAVAYFDCRIINMSWGIDEDDPYLKEVIDYVYEMGAILVAAVGNDSSEGLRYPAAYDNVIGVSSVTSSKTKSSFAQYNTSVTVTAPGENINSTSNIGGYTYLTGTSHSAPMVSGIAAVALSVNPRLTNTEFTKYLTETAEDLGDEGYDTSFGYGLVNEEALLDRMMEDIPVYVSPVNTTDTEAHVLVKNNSTHVLNALSIFAVKENEKNIPHIRTNLSLLPGEEMTIKSEDDANILSHFLLSGYNLKPVTVKR